MNILFVFRNPIIPYLGGVERVTSILAEGLRGNNHNVHFLATRPNKDHENLEISNYQLPLDSYSVFSNNPDQYLQYLKTNNINAVICQEVTPETIKLLENTPNNITKISCYHIQPYYFYKKEKIIWKNINFSSYIRKFQKFIYFNLPFIPRKLGIKRTNNEFFEMNRTSDKIILLSDKFIPRIQKFVDIPTHKFLSINNPNTFSISSQQETDEKEKIILYVARLEEFPKNGKGFLKMWEIFSKNNPNWTANIIGDGIARKELEEYVERKGLQNIRFLGQIKDVKPYFRKASFVCNTSFSEGWGMVLTEGMAYGCIPVAFDSYESVFDIIDDNKNGIIAKSFSSKDMANRIDQVANNPFLMTSFSEEAKKKALKFDISNIINDWESILK